MKRILNKLPLILLSTTLFFSTVVFSEPPNLSLLKHEIRKYHDSGLYQHELAHVIHKAQQFIVQQAIGNQKHQPPQKLAIVLDIDETSLSNYQFMDKRDFTGTKEQYHQEIMAANAPAIKPTLALYQDAIRHGVKVFFVTGRHQAERKATQKNLINAGYKHWAGLYLRPNHYRHHSIIPFKAQTRKLITEQGYTIVATIGDQYSDLKGGYAEKGFKLPNPFYYLP